MRLGLQRCFISGVGGTVCAMACSAAWGQPSTADPAPKAEPMPAAEAASAPVQRQRYLAGLVLEHSPPYAGAGFSKVELRPLLAFQAGRWRFSTSRATALLGVGAEVAGSGASTDLIESDRWKIGIALRYDSGRKSSQSTRLAGLPDVERTLRGRVYANYQLNPRWGLQFSANQDLLDRGGGLILRQGLGYELPFKFADLPMAWGAGVGLSWADRMHLRTRYGITPEQSAISGLSAFDPTAGLLEWSAGAGVSAALSSRWVMFGNLSSSRLLGDAARSPLTIDRGSARLSVGLAYRCCN